MRNLFISLLAVTFIQTILNYPPPQPVQASQETKTVTEAVKQPVKKKVVKDATKKKKPVKQAPVQPRAVSRSVPVAPAGTCVDWIRAAGVKDVSNAYALIMRESGCRVDADNPTSDAFGIPQSLPGSKMASHGADWATNPVTQIRWMQDYVNARYGGFAQANAFQLRNNWY